MTTPVPTQPAGPLRQFARLFQAERIKWRWNWTLAAAILAPLTQAMFLAVLCWYSESRIRPLKPGLQFWLELNYGAWNLLLMPLLAALVCELSWGQEREARAWNQLLSQPLPRASHFLVKFVSHLGLLWLAQALLALATPALGALLRTHLDRHMMGPMPWVFLLRLTVFSALACMPVVALHTWLSMRMPGLWAGMAVALAGTWTALQLVGRSSLTALWPWGMSAQLSFILVRTRPLSWACVLPSLAATGVILGLGILDFTRRAAPDRT